MDEMRITTKFMQGIIIKIIRKILVKKLGIDPTICFESPIELKIDGDTAQIHLNVTAIVSTDDISKIVKEYV